MPIRAVRLVTGLLVWLSLSRLLHADLPRVPEGYTVEIAAEAPLVRHPMLACFDERGRLFVCESAATNRRATELVEEPLDRICVLEDSDGDGVFDTSSTFADRLTFPQGCLWHQGALYTCSPPSLWKLEDTDDDGVCDRRTVIVDSFGFNGNGASIHGPFLGPQGRLYWCDGRHGHEFFDDQGHVTSTGRAARIFSCQPDGSDVRTYCGGGMDNPVEIDWLDTGEMIGTVNLFYGRPRGDCLVHWVEGGVYPRYDQEDCLAEFTWTGGILPEVHNYGHVAVSGMCLARSRRWNDAAPHSPPAAPRGSDTAGDRYSFFVTHFNTHRVVKTTLARAGSSFRHVETSDFIVWDDPDVHPTDVFEDDDGSLLVIDTGGWFRIGCPTSQIAKPEIPGAIYRVRREKGVRADRGAHVSKQTLAPGPNELTFMLSQGNAQQRLAAAQQLAQIFEDPDLNVDQDTKRPFVQAVTQALAATAVDPHLTHALVLALIRMNNAELTRPYLHHESPVLRRAALIALDQMPASDLQRDEAVALLDTSHADLQQAVLHVIRHREGWADAIVDRVRSWLLTEDMTPERAEAVLELLVAEADSESIQQLVADGLTGDSFSLSSRTVLLDAVAAAPLQSWPEMWTSAIGASLADAEKSVRMQSLAIVGRHGLEEFDERLERTAQNSDVPPDERIEAFAAVASRTKSVPDGLFQFLVGRLTGQTELLERLTIARGLATARLSDAQLSSLARSFDEIGAESVPVLLPAFEHSNAAAVGRDLVAHLAGFGGSLSVSPSELARLIERYPDAVREHARPLLAALGVDAQAQRERLDQLLAMTAEQTGHVDRGRAVFFGKTAACSSCHRLGDEGALIGPDLTKIGAIRQPRDLLEAIVFPSASFAREYRPYTVLTDAGRIFTGVIDRRTQGALTLRLADLSTVRVPGETIELLRESDTSIMPTGLDAKLTPDELRDLVTFLQSQR